MADHSHVGVGIRRRVLHVSSLENPVARETSKDRVTLLLLMGGLD